MRGRRAVIWGTLANGVILIGILAPLVGLLLGSIQTERDLFANVPNIWPKHVTAENLSALVLGVEVPGIPPHARSFPRAFANSTVVAIGVVLLTLFLATLASYAIARLRFRGSATLAYWLLATRMVPLIVLIVPLYVMLGRLSLLNSLGGLILAEAGLFLPYAIWILMGHFAAIPVEMEEAALIDGCTRLGALWRIVLPLAAPGLAACGVIVFLLSWNELLVPLILVSTQSGMTLPVLVSSFVTVRYLSYTVLNATGLLALVPTLVLALLVQRYIVRGLIAGALAGR
jgi:multiple sugar transport system permease protein